MGQVQAADGINEDVGRPVGYLTGCSAQTRRGMSNVRR